MDEKEFRIIRGCILDTMVSQNQICNLDKDVPPTDLIRQAEKKLRENIIRNLERQFDLDNREGGE